MSQDARAKRTRAAVGLVAAGFWFLCTGCGMRVPAPAVPLAGAPHVGWVIMVGDADNPNREFVCQSEPRTACVMPISRPDDQRFANVHFYFHPATLATKYSGTIQIGFLEDSAAQPHEFNPSVTVKPGEAPSNASVVGVVPSRPGSRDMRIEVTAEAATAQTLLDRVRVELK